MNNEIIFVINEQERIQVFLPCALDDIFRYDDIRVEYVKDNSCKHTIYVNDHIIEFVGVLNAALSDALSGRAKLDESIKEDLGLGWNQFLDDDNYSAKPEWAGRQYLLWCPRDVSSWLYEKNDKIFLELTPTYRWHSMDPTSEEREEYITFKQFMKSYKSYIITELSVDTIREWLTQTRRLSVQIEFNDDRYFIK